MRKQILMIYGVALSLGLLYVLWGSLTGLYLPCMYYESTGLLCPGCGLSRMFLSLLRLDFVSAFGHNPMMFIVFFYWNAVAILCFWGKLGFVKKPKFLYASLGVSVAFFIIFGILRNLY